MKTKIIIIGMIFFLLISFQSSAQWWNSWEKQTNPAVTGINDTWCENIHDPVVIELRGTLKMWFTAWDNDVRQIGYAESSDGIEWEIRSDPVMTGGDEDSWNRNVFPGTVRSIQGDTLEMWFTGATQDYSVYAIGYAMSISGGKSWYPNSNPVVVKGKPGDWDDSGVSNPVVHYDSLGYHMWYSNNDIGYATSSYGGDYWVKDSINSPVISHEELGNWYNEWVHPAGLIHSNDTIRMFINGFDGVSSDPLGYFRTGYAWTTDYTNWTVEYDGEPVLSLGSYGAWDSYGTAAGSVLFHNGQHKMWYSGQGNSYAIGFAESLMVGMSENGNQFQDKFKAFPNPFTTSITIEYELQQPSTIQIIIYNRLGKQLEVIQQTQSAGKQQVVWNAEAFPAGVYFCVLKTESGTQTMKMIKLK